jgi:hypothetical protein
MQSILTPFLLFLAAIVALLTYMFIPTIPNIALTTGAAILLAAGIWWHWTQFGVEYRTSTWQEQLRNYSSYVMVFVVILASYGFYVFAWQNDGALKETAVRATNAARNASRQMTAALTTNIGGNAGPRATNSGGLSGLFNSNRGNVGTNLGRRNTEGSANFLA